MGTLPTQSTEVERANYVQRRNFWGLGRRTRNKVTGHTPTDRSGLSQAPLPGLGRRSTLWAAAGGSVAVRTPPHPTLLGA